MLSFQTICMEFGNENVMLKAIKSFGQIHTRCADDFFYGLPTFANFQSST